MDEKMVVKLRRDLLWTRIFCVITWLLMGVVLVGGFLYYRKTQEYEQQLKKYVNEVKEHSEEIEIALDQVAQLDMEVLNDTIKETLKVIRAVDWEMLNENIDSVDWATLSKQLSELDVAAINDAVNSLDIDAINEIINSLDIDAINEIINGLDVVAISEAFENLDTEELTQTLENLNNGIDKLKKVVDTLTALGDKIGGIFK